MAKTNHDKAIEKASGKGKQVLVNGELVPIESLLSPEGVESAEAATERKDASAKVKEAAKADAASKEGNTAALSQSKREVNESRRVKGLRALIKNKLHYDPNWGLEEVMEACKKEKLLDKNGKLIKDESSDGETERVTPIEAKYRSDLQAKMLDADVDFEMAATTEELEDIWEAHVDTLEETPKAEMIRILKACGYELESEMTEAELKEELEDFRAEMVEVAKGLEVEFKGKDIEVLYKEVLAAKDLKDEEGDDVDPEESDADDVTPEPTAAPIAEVKEKDLSDKDKILLNARKDDLIAKIKKLGNPDLKPTKAYGLPKLEAMWKENRKSL